MGEKTGVINLYKPGGITSFDCIKKLRRLLGIKRIGHMGTLDPFADGVLPVALGKATRMIEYLSPGKKVYSSVFLFGIRTDTDDITGEIIEKKSLRGLPLSSIESVIESFKGLISQTPPRVSAIHIQGERAYKLARKKIDFEIPARDVEVFDISIIDYVEPRLTLQLTVSPGTYIRSIARDMGDKTGWGATVEKLTRLRSGRFKIEESFTLPQVEDLNANHSDIFIKDPSEYIENYPHMTLNETGMQHFINGRCFSSEHILRIEESRDEARVSEPASNIKIICMVLSGENKIIGTAVRTEDNRFKPEKVLI